MRDIDSSGDNAAQQLAVQYRIGGSGNWTNVPAGYIADATTGPSLATLVTPVSVSNAAFSNQPQLQFRIMTTNATGNDEWVGIDDIIVTSTEIGPTFTSTDTPAVAENTTPVVALSATDPSSPPQVITFTKTGGADSAKFALVGNQLSFLTAPDYENPNDADANGVYLVEVTANDGNGGVTTQLISVTVNNVNENPVASPQTFNVPENAVNGTVVGQVIATDGDDGTQFLFYSIGPGSQNGTGAGAFEIDFSGQIKVKDATQLDFENPQPFSLLIEIADDGTPSKFVIPTMTINVTDFDEFDATPIVDTDGAAEAIDENVAIGTAVGITASSTDDDGSNNTITYSLLNSAGGLFAIDSLTGVVTTAAAIDREATGATLMINVQAASSDGSTATQEFTIAINDLNEFTVSTPVDSDGAADAVFENAAPGSVVGVTISAADDDATDNVVTYSLFDDAGGKFVIDANTGVITTTLSFDREADASFNLIARATSADLSFADYAVTIAITDADEFPVTVPVDNDTATDEVNEGVPTGVAVGITAFATDADATGVISYSLFDDAGGRFTLIPGTGTVVTGNTTIDRETDGASLNIVVRATSTDGGFQDQTFNVLINDVNEFVVSAPTDNDGAVNQVLENSAAGVVVGITALATDADATTNGVTYSLSDDAGGRFAIDANTGVVTTGATNIDRENDGATIDIKVLATSLDGSTAESTFTVAVLGVNEFPSDVQPDFNDVTEDAVLVATGNVLTNDTDDDSPADPTTVAPAYVGTFPGAYGSLTLNANGSYTYTLNNSAAAVQVLNDGQTLSDSFNYAATDGVTTTGLTTLTITIHGADEVINITADGNDNTLVIDLDAQTYSLDGNGPFPLAGAVELNYEGGGGFDSLVINGANGGTVIYTLTNSSDGSIEFVGLGFTVNYTGLEPVANTGTVSDVVFDLTGVPDDAVLESDGAGGLRLRSVNGTFETTDFAFPGNSLTINGGAGDTLTVTQGLSVTGNIALNVPTVSLNANLTAGSLTGHGHDGERASRTRHRLETRLRWRL